MPEQPASLLHLFWVTWGALAVVAGLAEMVGRLREGLLMLLVVTLPALVAATLWP